MACYHCYITLCIAFATKIIGQKMGSVVPNSQTDYLCFLPNLKDPYVVSGCSQKLSIILTKAFSAHPRVNFLSSLNFWDIAQSFWWTSFFTFFTVLKNLAKMENPWVIDFLAKPCSLAWILKSLSSIRATWSVFLVFILFYFSTAVLFYGG